jgi:hypothetical protein
MFRTGADWRWISTLALGSAQGKPAAPDGIENVVSPVLNMSLEERSEMK